MISIQSIDRGWHTVREDLIQSDGYVLDAGCRGFQFAKQMSILGCRVLALDPGRDIKDPEIAKTVFLPVALADSVKRELFLNETNDLTSRLSPSGSDSVQCVSISYLMSKYHIHQFEVIKMDIEGGECEVLRNLTGPVAKQISVEFHPQFRTDWSIDSAVLHIKQWYDCVQSDQLDSLFVLRELV